MTLEARLQRLEAEVEALRTQFDQLKATPAPAVPAPSAPDHGALMQAIAEQVRRASLDASGTPQSLILQAVVEGPGHTYISYSRMDELDQAVDAAAMLKLAGVLASEPRLKILRALTAGERSAAEVGAAAGLEGGPLYHHLSELQEGGFLTQPSRGRYAMTRRGRDLYYQVALLVRTPYDEFPRAGA